MKQKGSQVSFIFLPSIFSTVRTPELFTATRFLWQRSFIYGSPILTAVFRCFWGNIFCPCFHMKCTAYLHPKTCYIFCYLNLWKISVTLFLIFNCLVRLIIYNVMTLLNAVHARYLNKIFLGKMRTWHENDKHIPRMEKFNYISWLSAILNYLLPECIHCCCF